MTATILARQFEMNARALEANIDGVDNEASLFQPPGGGNCVNWVVGHVLASRNSTHRLLGLEPAWTDAPEHYERGSEPITDARQATPVDQLLERFRASQTAVTDALEAVSDDELAAAPGAGDPDALQLAFLSFHESYHVGQLGILRRLLSLPPAIR